MKKLPHILHAYKCYHPDKGGIPTIIQQIAEGLQQSGHHEVLCTHRKFTAKKEMVNHIPVHRLGSLGNLFSLPITPHYPSTLWKLSHQFDILDYHFPMPWVDLAVAGYLPKSTKLIVHWHSEIIRQKKLAHCLSPLIHRCLQRADGIIVANQAHITHSTFLMPYQNKCKVIPFGIDISAWQQTTPEEHKKIQQLRQAYEPFILAAGRLVTYKGFDVLIKAMQYVPDAKLIIVGEGPLAAQLQQLSAQLQLTDRVYFFGETSISDLKCLYHAAHLFALPSVSENEAFGMVQLEAMACSKPIVNTALNSAVPTVARHQQEALTVPPGSVDALATAMNQLLAQPELVQQLAINAFRRVNNHYSLDNFLWETEKLYTSLK